MRNDLNKFPVPKNYPKEMCDKDGMLRPFRQYSERLIDSARIAHDKFVSGEWDGKTVEAYLSVDIINPTATKEILENARNDKAFFVARQEREDYPEGYRAIADHKLRNPSLYGHWRPPPSWKRRELQEHVDVLMHLVFLGVVKSIMKWIQYWMTLISKNTKLVCFGDGLLEELGNLHLLWLKCAPYKGRKFGGWVSEHYLGFARVARWFYSQIENLAKVEEWKEPESHYSTWTCKENRAWLRLRGLAPRENNAASAKTMVRQMMTRPEGPPEPLQKKWGPVPDVIDVITSMTAMISRLMATEIDEEHIVQTECRIKVFLNSVAKMDAPLEKKKGNEEPKWLSSYNFVCLLNLPDQMRRYGPLRNLWEGGWNGEGMIGIMKPEMKNGMQRNWPCN
jgi:hypothetical protein